MIGFSFDPEFGGLLEYKLYDCVCVVLNAFPL